MAVARLFKGPFTVDDYYRLAECGVLGPDARVELIDGQVVPMMPIGALHASRVDWLSQALITAAGHDYVVRVQNPTRLGNRSEPQPDLMVLRHRDDFYRHAHPTPADVLLLIEVSDTTIDYDRDVKVPLYARSGVPEVWIGDLQAERVEVYRERSDGMYRSTRIHRPGETVTTSMVPGVSLAVSDILGLP